jgi:hypothetical protein
MKLSLIVIVACSTIASFNANAQMGDDIAVYSDSPYINLPGLERGAAIVLTDGVDGCTDGKNSYKIIDSIGIKIGGGCWTFDDFTGSADLTGIGLLPAGLFKPTQRAREKLHKPAPEQRRGFVPSLPYGSGDYNNPGWRSW